MKNEHVLSGLMAKRAELAGQIETMERQIRALVVSLDHVDAAIRLFDPDVRPSSPNCRLVISRFAARCSGLCLMVSASPANSLSLN